MDITSIIISILTSLFTLVGVISTNTVQNRKNAILMEYRLKQIEDKVGKFNHFTERMAIQEQSAKSLQYQVNEIKGDIKKNK